MEKPCWVLPGNHGGVQLDERQHKHGALCAVWSMKAYRQKMQAPEVQQCEFRRPNEHKQI